MFQYFLEYGKFNFLILNADFTSKYFVHCDILLLCSEKHIKPFLMIDIKYFGKLGIF